MSTATLLIGPEHVGERMSLSDFENAEAGNDRLYELARGIVTMIDVPNRAHQRQLNAIKQQLNAYATAKPGTIDSISAGNECRIPVVEENSERHPDLAIYKTIPPEIESRELWGVWVPELVVEVVSPDSAGRDYHEKPREYLRFGIREYWIVDGEQEMLTVLQRSGGRWTEKKTKPPEKHNTHLLPGFELDIAAVFASAK